MDLKSMNSIIWLILFGVLAIVPGKYATFDFHCNLLNNFNCREL